MHALLERTDIVISPVREICAYEALWLQHSTVKQVADAFRLHGHAPPSHVAKAEGVSESQLEQVRRALEEQLPFNRYTALFYRDFDYPEALRDARHPVEVVYLRGDWDLLASRCVSVVGTREPSEEGRARARRLTRWLVEHNFTVMSGLAQGIDTVAHETALASGGRTVAVMGTSLAETYPRENRALRARIEAQHLVLTQVPFVLSSRRNWRTNRGFFPERNKTMSALSEATIIVEAGETSGTLIQARAALEQKRKLLILDACFRAGLEWPGRFLERGAHRVTSNDDLRTILLEQG